MAKIPLQAMQIPGMAPLSGAPPNKDGGVYRNFNDVPKNSNTKSLKPFEETKNK